MLVYLIQFKATILFHEYVIAEIKDNIRTYQLTVII